MTAKPFDIVTIPPSLSESERDVERQCLEAIDRLRTQYMRGVEPYQRMIAEIYTRHGPQFMIVPRDRDDNSDT